MIEQARAQLVDHPLADRDRDVVRHHVEQAQQRVQDDEADARRDEELAARHRGNPRAHERSSAQNVIDYDFERPRLEHFGRGGKQHAGNRNRETAEMRTHPANRVAVEFQRGHRASSSARVTIEIPSEPATSEAHALMIAGTRRARVIAINPNARVAKTTPTIAAPSEKPAASKTRKVTAAAINPRRGSGRMRQIRAMLASLRKALIGARISGGMTSSGS